MLELSVYLLIRRGKKPIMLTMVLGLLLILNWEISVFYVVVYKLTAGAYYIIVSGGKNGV